MASGNVLIPNWLVKMYSHANSNNPFSSCALLYVKCLCLSGECLDGVCGSPTVSGSYLGVSSRCLGSLHVILIING